MDKKLRKIEINAICKINRALALGLKGGIFEQIIKETVQEAIDYAHSCKKLVCDHPRSERTYIGENTLKCGICGKEFK